ncbi:MAG TPA: DUF4345 domain-containing protein [Edaphocola sp.]|nr:DUF4345 domain-containing protein [Edaphocola sp.]
MELALRILFGIIALICFLGGTNIMIKGAIAFLPKETAPQLILDNLIRFLAGIYISFGFLLVYAVFNVEHLGNIVYFLGIIVGCSGLGRGYSRYKIGSAGRYFDIIMLVEILLGLSIIGLQWFR